MHSLRKPFLTICAFTLPIVLAACGGPTPVTSETPQASYTPAPWGNVPTPPAEVMSDAAAREGLITLSHEEGAAVFSLRSTGRQIRTSKDNLGQPLSRIVFSFEIKNNTPYSVTKTSGLLFYQDTSGKVLETNRLFLESTIEAGKAIVQQNDLNDLDLIENRKLLKEAPLEQLHLEYRPLFINYAVGTGQAVEYDK